MWVQLPVDLLSRPKPGVNKRISRGLPRVIGGQYFGFGSNFQGSEGKIELASRGGQKFTLSGGVHVVCNAKILLRISLGIYDEKSHINHYFNGLT